MVYDVLIAGAGPAGCTAALALKDAGLKVLLLEKSIFPRDKVCGDAIPSRAIAVLKTIAPELVTEMSTFNKLLLTKRTQIVYNTKSLHFNWKIPAYTCTRMDFDNKLFGMVEEHTDTTIIQNTRLRSITKNSKGYAVADDKGNVYNARLVIGADGAQSIVAKQLAGYKLDREHHIAAVRAYYKNVSGVDEHCTEMYVNKQFSPGYFWIFPIEGGMANVGFGMLSCDVAERNINMKQSLQNFINTVPELQERFKQATAVTGIEGHSLPVGSRRVTMSGEAFMLAGDAASLIDPITGEGIGNAMLSGRLAALQAIQCFGKNNFSAGFMLAYDDAVWEALGGELSFHAKAQKVLRQSPWLLNIVFALGKIEPIRRLMQKRF